MTGHRIDPAELMARAHARAPTLGSGRLICIDGPAGSGKTTLGRAVGQSADCPVVHLDDLYEGWSGLLGVADRLAGLLEPLARDQPGRYRRYDWLAAAFAEEVVVEPGPLLVVEGVGAGVARIADLVTLLVWVDADPALRRARAIARDGAELAARWDAWASDEAVLFARERTAERADVRLEGGASG